MGYHTKFKGRFKLDRPLARAQVAYLQRFSETRCMKRDAKITADRPDPLREAVGLPVGVEGEYFVGEGGLAGQGEWLRSRTMERRLQLMRDLGVIDPNDPPSTQPGLWCEWIPDSTGNYIEWNGQEKFYDYVEWLRYIIDNFLKPWGLALNGTVKWHGEERTDRGSIRVINNMVFAGNPPEIPATIQLAEAAK